MPTPMSYTIFFSGVDFNKPLSRDAKERINTIWKQWQSYCEKAADPNDSMHELAQTPEYRISSIPTNAYLASFPKVGSDISRLSELVDSLSSSPSFVPTAHTFSVIFRSVSTSLSSSTQTDQTEHATRCYELCRKAWDFMYDSWQSNGLQLDALALSAAVTAYREIFKAAPFLFSQELKQRLLDQLEALIGLQRTESTAEDMPTVHAKAPKKMDSTVIYDAMVLASAFEGRYSGHILDWFTTLRQHEPTLLDARVCEMYMKAAPRSALGERNDPRICEQGTSLTTLTSAETLVYMLRSPSTAMRPSLSTYTTAISLSPFIDQVRIIAHMSGRSEILEASEAPLLQTKMETFDQERALSKRALEKGYHTKHIQPDNKIMAILLQTALDLQDWRRIDRAVKIATIFSANGVVNGTTTASEPMKAVKYALRLSENMAEACDKLLTNPAVPEARKEELRSMQKQQVTRRRPRLSTSSWSR